MSKHEKTPKTNPSAQTPHKNQSKIHKLNLDEDEKYLLFQVLSEIRENMQQFTDPEPVNYYFYQKKLSNGEISESYGMPGYILERLSKIEEKLAYSLVDKSRLVVGA